MSSLKRYRQTNDSNAAARFRDLPPRFKRQKSVPSPEDDNVDCHKQSQNYKPKKSSQGDSTVLSGSTATIPFHSPVNKESETSKDKRMLRKGTGNRPFLNVEQNNVRRLTQPIVLSPMDNKLFDLNRNDMQDNQIISTVNPLSWQNQQQVAWPHYSYEQTNVSQANMSSFNGRWISPPNTNETNRYPETASTPPKDYSETDRRIIEMFKELERVADQKEKEENENGADRKSLVSHHLRMLMCAIDKYTEGIEDDDTDSNSRDEEVPSEDRSTSPSAVKEIVKTALPSPVTSVMQQPAQCSAAPVFSTSIVQTIPPSYVQSQQTAPFPIQTDIMPQQAHHVRDYFSQGKPFEFSPKIKPSLSSIDMQPWDLWSSPSFNVLDVYSNLSKGHNSSETADSTFALFDQLGMENDYSPRAEEYLTRTPLYKR